MSSVVAHLSLIFSIYCDVAPKDSPCFSSKLSRSASTLASDFVLAYVEGGILMVACLHMRLACSMSLLVLAVGAADAGSGFFLFCFLLSWSAELLRFLGDDPCSSCCSFASCCSATTCRPGHVLWQGELLAFQKGTQHVACDNSLVGQHRSSAGALLVSSQVCTLSTNFCMKSLRDIKLFSGNPKSSSNNFRQAFMVKVLQTISIAEHKLDTDVTCGGTGARTQDWPL